jgi:hypothetical protein
MGNCEWTGATHRTIRRLAEDARQRRELDGNPIDLDL